MNKTKLFDTEEKYISPAVKVVEMDPQNLVCTSGEGRADVGYDENDLGTI